MSVETTYCIHMWVAWSYLLAYISELLSLWCVISIFGWWFIVFILVFFILVLIFAIALGFSFGFHACVVFWVLPLYCVMGSCGLVITIGCECILWARTVITTQVITLIIYGWAIVRTIRTIVKYYSLVNHVQKIFGAGVTHSLLQFPFYTGSVAALIWIVGFIFLACHQC